MMGLSFLAAKKLPVKALLVVLLGLFLTSGCSFLERSGAWVQPEVKVVDNRLVGLSLTKALLEVELEVSNPNRYSILVGALDFQLDLQDAKILAGQQLQGNKLAAGKKQSIILPLEIGFADLGKFITNLSDLNALNYRVAGGMSFDIPVAGPLRVPYETKGEIPIPHLPEFSLIGVEQKRLSLTGADLVMSVELDNPNAFDLLVNKLQYSSWIQLASATACNSSNNTSFGVFIPSVFLGRLFKR
ncbi:LEA type 2 family protein, partial [Marinospirillum insulare]|uniref:NDR1/HIN1-like protein n=1 Tax=Marinospirillum insulare TaxID=217169 RepID=UPI0024E0FDE9